MTIHDDAITTIAGTVVSGVRRRGHHGEGQQEEGWDEKATRFTDGFCFHGRAPGTA